MYIIISGASRGIGKAIALQLAKKKHGLILLARNTNELENVATQTTALGADTLIFGCDVTQENDIKKVFEQLQQQHIITSVIINNAGIGGFKPLQDFSLEEYDQMMNVNVKGSFLLTKYFLPVMQAKKNGHIITIASDVSKRTFENGTLYCATKYAQDAMFSALRKEVRKDNIKVSIIYSGLVDTYFAGNNPSQKTDRLQPDDIAQAVDYILSAPQNVVIDELMIHPITQVY